MIPATMTALSSPTTSILQQFSQQFMPLGKSIGNVWRLMAPNSVLLVASVRSDGNGGRQQRLLRYPVYSDVATPQLFGGDNGSGFLSIDGHDPLHLERHPLYRIRWFTGGVTTLRTSCVLSLSYGFTGLQRFDLEHVSPGRWEKPLLRISQDHG